MRSEISPGEAGRAYLDRFGKNESDLHHVERALTWFEDAEKNPVRVAGLDAALWRRIKLFFESRPRRATTRTSTSPTSSVFGDGSS